MVPIYDRKSEVEALLATDDTVVGRVWRYQQEGNSIREIADLVGVTPGPIYAADSLIRVLRDGYVTPGPSVATQSAARVRSWLKMPNLSPELRNDLEATESQLMVRAQDRDAQEGEEQAAVAVTKKVVAERVPGIYVYTLPHYWRHKIDPENDQTYLKVGKSDTDVFSRVDQQRTTALPEDPWLLRVYQTGDAGDAERKFHAMLDAADHRRTVSKKGGREWFLTSLRILDWYAADQGLEIQRPNESTVGEE